MCKCVRGRTAASQIIIIDKGDVPCRVEKLPRVLETPGGVQRGKGGVQMTASFIHERGSKTE